MQRRTGCRGEALVLGKSLDAKEQAQKHILSGGEAHISHLLEQLDGGNVSEKAHLRVSHVVGVVIPRIA